MIFITDNCTKWKRHKWVKTVRGALERTYRKVFTDIAGTSAERQIDKVYMAWSEYFYGEVQERLYMRIWCNGEGVSHLILLYLPDEWEVLYMAQGGGVK